MWGGTVRNSEEHIDSSAKVGRKGMKQTIINRKSLSLPFSATGSGKRHANLRTGEPDKDLQNEGSIVGVVTPKPKKTQNSLLNQLRTI